MWKLQGDVCWCTGIEEAAQNKTEEAERSFSLTQGLCVRTDVDHDLEFKLHLNPTQPGEGKFPQQQVCPGRPKIHRNTLTPPLGRGQSGARSAFLHN